MKNTRIQVCLDSDTKQLLEQTAKLLGISSSKLVSIICDNSLTFVKSLAHAHESTRVDRLDSIQRALLTICNNSKSN